MQAEQFRSTLHHQPFRPFVIHTADGRSFRVDHPDFVAQSPAGRSVIVFRGDDSHSVLDLLLITELEVLAPDGNEAA
ncbi:MAG: hypothetical protein AAF612_09705 [Planctomycetota bacterium]